MTGAQRIEEIRMVGETTFLEKVVYVEEALANVVAKKLAGRDFHRIAAFDREALIEDMKSACANEGRDIEVVDDLVYLHMSEKFMCVEPEARLLPPRTEAEIMAEIASEEDVYSEPAGTGEEAATSTTGGKRRAEDAVDPSGGAGASGAAGAAYTHPFNPIPRPTQTGNPPMYDMRRPCPAPPRPAGQMQDPMVEDDAARMATLARFLADADPHDVEWDDPIKMKAIADGAAEFAKMKKQGRGE